MQYHQGDLFKFVDSLNGSVMVSHIVNDANVMGSGFVIPLYTKWPIVKQLYHKWDMSLGKTQIIIVKEDEESEVFVANMCAQSGICSKSTGPRSKVNSKPIRYASLVRCMEDVANYVRAYKIDHIVAPMFGSGLAGGNWSTIEELIEEIWGDLNVTICRL
jgi:hypothetical protein